MCAEPSQAAHPGATVPAACSPHAQAHPDQQELWAERDIPKRQVEMEGHVHQTGKCSLPCSPPRKSKAPRDLCDQAVTGDGPDLHLLLGVRGVPSAGVLRITAAACVRAQVPPHMSVPACRGRGPLLGPPPHWTAGQMPKQNEESILVPAMRMSVLP